MCYTSLNSQIGEIGAQLRQLRLRRQDKAIAEEDKAKETQGQ